MVKETTPTKTVEKPCKHCGGFERYESTNQCTCYAERLLAARGGHKPRKVANPKSPQERYENGRRSRPLLVLWRGARNRAKKAGKEFSITVADLGEMPTHCPILGIPLVTRIKPGTVLPDTPSIDRIENRLGYIPGNVQIVSWIANYMKKVATLDQLVIMGRWAQVERNRREAGG